MADALISQPREVLKRYFGYDGFRPNQQQVVDAILQGRDVLAVMPTGAGKSICYQVPAMCLMGYTLVVSPLISLMKDQVNALDAAGVPAGCINSSVSAAGRREAVQGVMDGSVKLLYVSPERLETEEFRDLCANFPPQMIAIDEAHCISQWGHDFRPSYTRLRRFIESLPQRPPVCAFTATATERVRQDILEQLALRDPFTVVASFDRPNLRFSVIRPRERDKDKRLLELLEKHSGESGIIYCSTRKAVEAVYDLLCEKGVSAARYHAALPQAERRASQEDFIYDRASVIVATNAFGMGIDKSDVRFVIHYNMPLDLEEYYQEAGRAGRDGEPAECVLLYTPKDVKTAEFMVIRSKDEADLDADTRYEQVQRAQDRLRQMTFYSTTSDCLRGFILKYFGETAPGYCGACGNCETEFEDRDVTEDAQKIISCVYRLQQRGRQLGRAAIVDILRGSKTERITQNGFDTLSTYGLLADESKTHVRFVMEELINREILGVTHGQYPQVVFTQSSGEFLRNGEPFVIKVPKEKPKQGLVKDKRKNGRWVYGDEPVDKDLFQKLREARAHRAAMLGYPAYVVFNDATLADMCRRMPVTREELLEVSGVGEAKAARYGEEFMDIIRTHKEQHGL